jgi:maltose/moltooligosaccharide transporter
MFLDTSINMAMQPFKMLVGDMVNEKQKTKAYSIQSFLCNAGSLMGYLFPIFFTWIGIKNVAEEGVIPDSVIYSFYIGAAILILCVLYTTAKVKEWNPQEYAEYNGTGESEAETQVAENEAGKKSGERFDKLLLNAPSAFWSVGLVQFFCWAAFMFMWTYTNGTIAANIFDTPTVERGGAFVLDTTSVQYQSAANWVGVLFAVQAIGSVLWAIVIPMIKNIKAAYIISLVLGGIGFISTNFITDQHVIFISFLLIGCAWAAMLALPFTILTNALTGYGHMGTYLGLFNGTICLPQIIAASLGGVILGLFSVPEGTAAPEPYMLVIAGVLLFAGAAAVLLIREKN